MNAGTFQSVFGAFKDPVVIQDLDGCVLDLNPSAARFCECMRDDAVGRNLSELFQPAQPADRADLEKLAGGDIEELRGVLLSTNGHFLAVDVQTSDVQYAGKRGRMIHLHGTSQPLFTAPDEQRQAVKAELIMSKVQTGLLLVGDKGAVLEANEAACRLLGYTHQEMRALQLSDIDPSVNGADEAAGVVSWLNIGSGPYEARWRRNGGDWVDVEIDPDIVESEDGPIIFSFVRDITRRKRALRMQSVLYEIAHRAITADELNDLLSFVHEALAQLLPVENFYVALFDKEREWVSVPYSSGELDSKLLSRPLKNTMADYVLTTGEPFRLSAEGAMEQLEETGFEIHGRKPSDWLGAPLVLDEQAIGVIVLRDYSIANRYSREDQELLEYVAGQIAVLIQRKGSEQELRMSEERYRRHFNEDLSGDFVALPDGSLDACNKAFADMFGYPSEKAVRRKKFSSHFPSKKLWGEFVKRLKEKGILENFEFDLRRKDGSTIYLVGKMLAGFDEKGALAEIRGYLIDITEHVQLQDQFLQAQKMEAIGRLAEGVAHDFNNLLTPIIGYGRLILDKSDIQPPFRDDVVQIVRAGERATDLTKKMLGFGRKQDFKYIPTDLNRVVLDLENLLRRTLGPDIDLDLDLEPDAGTVKADAGMLEQVLMNLGVNARDAMENTNGRLKIQTRNVLYRPGARFTPHGIEPGDYVLLSVQDNGCGMPADVQAKAFDPFFTTKDASKGTGLGLSTVYGIIKQLKGFVDLNSKEGQGTTMNIYLTRIDEPPESQQLELEVLVPRGTETILLVEDDDTVRAATIRIMESLGYKLIPAKNGGEAVMIGEEYEEPIDLLLADVVMPVMTGSVVVSRLRQIRNDFKVLFMSGYGEDNMGEHDPDAIGVPFIQKPCTHRTLGEVVRRVLDGREK